MLCFGNYVLNENTFFKVRKLGEKKTLKQITTTVATKTEIKIFRKNPELLY